MITDEGKNRLRFSHYKTKKKKWISITRLRRKMKENNVEYKKLVIVKRFQFAIVNIKSIQLWIISNYEKKTKL